MAASEFSQKVRANVRREKERGGIAFSIENSGVVVTCFSQENRSLGVSNANQTWLFRLAQE